FDDFTFAFSFQGATSIRQTRAAELEMHRHLAVPA
ncbi:hypothetical protein PPOP_2227, partial [Paenibacillus popilliae ATCC 14706]